MRSAVVLMSRAEAERRGVAPLGELVSYGMVAGPDNASLLHQPSRAILKAAERAGIDVADLDLFEINEAFAAVGIASIAELGISDEIVNVNGGAIALGHPIGMSGNRLALTMLHELRRRGGGIGAVALCGGGGQGDAAILARVLIRSRELRNSPVRDVACRHDVALRCGSEEGAIVTHTGDSKPNCCGYLTNSSGISVM